MFFKKTRDRYAAMRQCVRSTYCRLRYLHKQFLLKETYVFAPLVSTFKQYAFTGLSGCLTLYIRTVTQTMMPSFLPLLLLCYSYLHTLWLHGPLRTLSSRITDVPSTLSTAFCRHLLAFISRRFLSTSSSHLYLGLSIRILPSPLLSDIFLTVIP